MDANELTTKPKRQTGQADAAQRAQRAWLARVAGASWSQAAEVSGYSSAAVCCRAVSRFFGRLPDQDREATRDLWRERVEVLWRQSMVDVKAQRPGAIRSAVAVAQRASALDGLDAPTMTRVSITPDAVEFSRVVDALSALKGSDVPEEGDIFEEGPDGVYEVTSASLTGEGEEGEGTAPTPALAHQA